MSNIINIYSVITAASNGLHLDTNTIKLGGALTEATTITADVTNTLAIAGLQTGSAADNIVMADPTTGVLKRVVGSTYLTTSGAATTYVPYTGATTNVNLGAFGISAASFNSLLLGLGGGSVSSNVAIGINALLNNTVGVANVAIGNLALLTLASGPAINASRNVAIGSNVGQIMTIGASNTFVGDSAGASFTSGYFNTMIGYRAGRLVPSGDGNVIIGSYSGSSAISNHLILSNGAGSLRIIDNNVDTIITRLAGTGVRIVTANTNGELSTGGLLTDYVPYTGATTNLNLGSFNYSGGTFNGLRVTLGGGAITSNVAIGNNALFSNGSATSTVAIGNAALLLLSSGAGNTGIGDNALSNLSGANYNSAFGVGALSTLTTGGNNFGGGGFTGGDLTTGSYNTLVGTLAGGGIVTGSNNTIIGARVLSLASGLANNIILANGAGTIRFQDDNTNTILSRLAGTGTRFVLAGTNGELSAGALYSTLITSSATAGYVPYMSTATNLANSGFFWDGSNIGLGITASILAKLHIRGAGTTSATKGIWIENSTGTTTTPIFATYDNGDIFFNGGVSINRGTSVGNFSLHVNGSIGAHDADGFSGWSSGTTYYSYYRAGSNVILNRATGNSLLFNYNGSTQASLNTTGGFTVAGLAGVGTRIPNISAAGLFGELSGTGLIRMAGSVVSFDNAAYITLTSLSSTATGLTYTDTTGVFSLTAGYVIPTTSQIISSFTTTGSSGAATFSGGTLNIPNYTIGGLGGVTSTATAGYIPYMSTATNVANSAAFYDGMNTGFGTITPSSKVHISGAIGLQSALILTNTTDSVSAVIFPSTATTVFGTQQGNGILFGSYATPTSISGFTEYGSYDSTGNLVNVASTRTLYTSGFYLNNAGTMQSRWYQSGTDVIFDRISPTAFVWQQATTTQLVLDTNGNIGQSSTGVSSWDGSFRLFQQEGHAAWYSSTSSNQTFLADNIYYSGGLKYFSNGYGTRVTLNSVSGAIAFDMADTGLTGTAATLTTRFNVNYDGSMQFTNTAGTKFFAYQNGNAVTLTGSIGGGSGSVNYTAGNADATGYSSYGLSNGGTKVSLSTYNASYATSTYGAKSLANTSVLEFVNEGIIGYTAASGLSVYTTAGTQVLNFTSLGETNVKNALYADNMTFQKFSTTSGIDASWIGHYGATGQAIIEESGTTLSNGYVQQIVYAQGSGNDWKFAMYSASFATSGMEIASTALHEYGTTVNNNIKNSGTWNVYMAGTRVLTMKASGVLNYANCPTSSAGLVAGDIWSNAGVLTIV